mmetsp:Transcript_11120/g.27202  ORF Transcript_11120/g.27202 Transcript_11120/m.27202 type:complete len:249 (+) Transcript_11120:1310-2056(+)
MEDVCVHVRKLFDHVFLPFLTCLPLGRGGVDHIGEVGIRFSYFFLQVVHPRRRVPSVCEFVPLEVLALEQLPVVAFAPLVLFAVPAGVTVIVTENPFPDGTLRSSRFSTSHDLVVHQVVHEFRQFLLWDDIGDQRVVLVAAKSVRDAVIFDRDFQRFLGSRTESKSTLREALLHLDLHLLRNLELLGFAGFRRFVSKTRSVIVGVGKILDGRGKEAAVGEHFEAPLHCGGAVLVRRNLRDDLSSAPEV